MWQIIFGVLWLGCGVLPAIEMLRIERHLFPAILLALTGLLFGPIGYITLSFIYGKVWWFND